MTSKNDSSIEEIDEKIRDLEAQKEEALRREKQRIAQENFEEARSIIARLIDDVCRLEKLGYLPPVLSKNMRHENGNFVPRSYLKSPLKPR